MSIRKIEKKLACELVRSGIDDHLLRRKPILISDSKGFTLRNSYLKKYPSLNHYPLELWCIAGATTEKLIELLVERLPKAIKRHENITLYLWSGTCDLSSKRSGKLELVCWDDTKVSEVKDSFKKAFTLMSGFPSVTLKILECPQYSISKWNEFKGYQRDIELDRLVEKELNRQVATLNSYIRVLNDDHNSNTLNINNCVIRARGGRKSKRNRVSVNLKLYKDGIHPGEILSELWTLMIIDAICKSCCVSEKDLKDDVLDLNPGYECTYAFSIRQGYFATRLFKLFDCTCMTSYGSMKYELL